MKNKSGLVILTMYILPCVLLACIASKKNKETIELNEKNVAPTYEQQDTTPRVTGIGGVFFRSESPANLNAWYGKHLGLAIDDYGSPFEFRNANHPDQINYLRWSPFEKNTEYLQPSEKDFMINYRVYNLAGLVRNMKQDSIEFLDEITEYDYGKFIHLMDPEGNKLELWEPNDAFLTTLGGKTTK